jgi:hypothetical protein
MYRDPHKWYKSLLEWQWLHKFGPVTAGQKVPNHFETAFNSQMKFTLDMETNNMTLPMARLSTEYVWWGISDHWKTSVCIFHCEMGGVERPSETMNTRSSEALKDADEVEKQIPEALHRKTLVPNMTEYVNENYSFDIKFYHEVLIPAFQIRATRCLCKMY